MRCYVLCGVCCGLGCVVVFVECWFCIVSFVVFGCVSMFMCVLTYWFVLFVVCGVSVVVV